MKLPLFEKDLSRAKTLTSKAYFDTEIEALERDRIFARTWQPVGNLADVSEAGAYFTSEVAGEQILVIRGDDGTLRAFYNVCRHRAGPLADGKGKKKQITCRYHGWTYAQTGNLLLTPEFEGVNDFDKSCYGLRGVRVDTFGPFVFVNLDDGAEPLASVLGDIPKETASYDLAAYQPISRRDYDVKCNWKVYVDNYLEGYHLPIVHPGLFRELDYSQYRVDTHRLHSAQYAPIRPVREGQANRQYDESEGGALYYWVFPNWMLNIYPDNMSINVIVPKSTGETVTIFEWFVKDKEAMKDRIEQTMAFSHEIQVEDISICEAVQKRIGSRAYAEGGRFSVKRENGVHHFQSLISAYLSGESV